MSKYGFNESEIRKSIIDMIDKDGFHKEVVMNGAPKALHMATGLLDLVVSGALSNDFFYVHILSVNVPEGAELYMLPSETDDDWALGIGDTLEDTTGYVHNNTEIAGTDAVRSISSSYEEGTTVYFQIYAVDSEFKVLDRTKLTVEVTVE